MSEQPDTVMEATGAAARLARVYAEALMAQAREAQQVDAVGDELASIVGDVLKSSPESEAFLVSSAVNRKVKEPTIASAFGNATSELIQKFLGVLNDNNRLGLLRSINATYQKLRDQSQGRTRVKVVSAIDLNEQQTEQLKSTLKQSMKVEPVLEMRTDPEILGGLIVQIGDRVFDSSVRTRLNSLRTHLMTSGTHGA